MRKDRYHGLTQNLSLVHVVCGEHDGATVTVPQEEVPDLPASERVHPRGGLVQDDCARASHKGQEDGELALHSPREVPSQLISVGQQIHLGQPPGDTTVNTLSAACLD